MIRISLLRDSTLGNGAVPRGLDPSPARARSRYASGSWLHKTSPYQLKTEVYPAHSHPITSISPKTPYARPKVTRLLDLLFHTQQTDFENPARPKPRSSFHNLHHALIISQCEARKTYQPKPRKKELRLP